MSKSILLLLTGDIRTVDPLLQEQVYKEFYRLVYPLIMYIMKDPRAVEDIIHEAFLLIIRKSPHEVDEDRLIPWIRAIARNTTISYLRKHQKQRLGLLQDDFYMENAVPLMSDPNGSTEAKVEAKLMEEAIIHYIHQMKPIYRQVIHMRWIERLSYKEMAQKLGVSEEKIRQTLHRSRESIRRKLARDWKVSES